MRIPTVTASGLALAAILALATCKDDDTTTDIVGPTVSEHFVATLSGANIVPPNAVTTATGSAEFTVYNGLPGIFFKVSVAGIDSVTLAHIHGPASTTTSAGVILNLYLGPKTGPAITGVLAQGAAPSAQGLTSDSILSLLRSGNAYVNVHTVAFPGGEIRGQVSKQ